MKNQINMIIKGKEKKMEKEEDTIKKIKTILKII